MAGEMGFGLFSAFLVVENPFDKKITVFHSVDNTPSAYFETSRDAKTIARDPVIKRLKSLSTPFVYDQDLYVTEGAGDIWEKQAAFGYRVGINVALHLPNYQHFVLGMDRDNALPVSREKMSRMLAALQFLAVHAQVAATRLILPLLKKRVPKLSQRELESLKWTIEGKTAWEVGVILGISERSVVFHLTNSMRKLGAINKHQAALKAIGLGLIR